MGTLVTKQMRTASVTTAAPVAKPASIKPRHMPYGDAARVLGTIAVVIGHCCDMIVFSPHVTATDWWVCNIADAASRWAVPVYVMLSGALLLDPHRSEAPSEFYSKRLARLGVPIVFWSALYMWFSVHIKWATPEQAWQNLAQGQPYAHLHFVFRIAGLYAFTPMLRVFLKHAEERMVALTVVLLLGLSTANSMMSAWTGGELSMFLRFTPFLGFYLLGYLLRERKISKRALLGCWMLAISCVLLLAGGTGLLSEIYNTRSYPSPAYVLYDFLSPVRITLAICAWLIVVNTFDEKWFNSPLGKFNTKWLAPATLGIYLVHLAFREVLFMNGFNAIWPNVWIGIPLNAAMVYIPSVIAVLIVMRIPFVRRIVV